MKTGREVDCLCPVCNEHYEPICTNNGNMYASACHLKKFSCEKGISLVAVNNDACCKYIFN